MKSCTALLALLVIFISVPIPRINAAWGPEASEAAAWMEERERMAPRMEEERSIKSQDSWEIPTDRLTVEGGADRRIPPDRVIDYENISPSSVDPDAPQIGNKAGKVLGIHGEVEAGAAAERARQAELSERVRKERAQRSAAAAANAFLDGKGPPFISGGVSSDSAGFAGYLSGEVEYVNKREEYLAWWRKALLEFDTLDLPEIAGESMEEFLQRLPEGRQHSLQSVRSAMMEKIRKMPMKEREGATKVMQEYLEKANLRGRDYVEEYHVEHTNSRAVAGEASEQGHNQLSKQGGVTALSVAGGGAVGLLGAYIALSVQKDNGFEPEQWLHRLD